MFVGVPLGEAVGGVVGPAVSLEGGGDFLALGFVVGLILLLGASCLDREYLVSDVLQLVLQFFDIGKFS